MGAGCRSGDPSRGREAERSPDAQVAAPSPPPAPAPDRISGTLKIAGKPVAIERCRPGREASIYVDLVTARGALRFLAYEDRTMFWTSRPDSTERGAPLACSDLRRSWGGATRPDGSTYFRGQIIFSCRGAIGAVVGDVTVDCGNISALERKLLDESRRRKRDELAAPGSADPARTTP
jgi:hypothetical protein